MTTTILVFAVIGLLNTISEILGEIFDAIDSEEE